MAFLKGEIGPPGPPGRPSTGEFISSIDEILSEHKVIRNIIENCRVFIPLKKQGCSI